MWSGGRKNKLIECTCHKSIRGAVGREKGNWEKAWGERKGGSRESNENNIWKWHNEIHYLLYHISKISQIKIHFSYLKTCMVP